MGVTVTQQARAFAIRLGERATQVERTGAKILADALARGNAPSPIVTTGEPSDGDIMVGTPASSSLVAANAGTFDLADLGDEGFVVRSLTRASGRNLVIAANDPRGILYACAAVADRLQLGDALDRIDLREKPALPHRNLWTWSGPKGSPRAFFNLDRMRNADKEPRFHELGRYLARARINTLTLWPDPDCRPDVGPNRDQVLDAYRALTHFIRHNYGIECYLFMWYEVSQGTPTPIVGWPICPFNERVIEHWNERIDRLIRELPDLRGIVMAGAGGDWIRGPWECRCPECRKHADRELLIRAMQMIGQRWADAGGKIIWKAVTDRPTLVKTEVENFADLDDLLPPYIQIAHKTFYKDFRQPHPLHPIFFAHEDQTDRRRPYLCEFQIYGEYRGGTDFPCVMIDRWSEIAPLVTRKGYAGAMGICSFDRADRWDHPLNMANWYAFGRYAWDPDESPDVIYRDWATLTFGPEAAEAVVDICRTSYRASTKMMFFRGVMTQNHSKLPTIDYELESSLIGPWHHIPKAPDGHWGRGHDVSMYPPEIAEQMRSDPDLLLWAHRVPVTPELCDQAIAEKREALQLVQRMTEEWEAIPHTGWSELHGEISRSFKRNCVDAELWYEAHRLYFDYKAGRLTRTELGRRTVEIKAGFDPRDGTGLIRDTFDRFIEEWERVYNGNLVRRSMEGKYRNPEGEPFLPGLKPEPRRQA